MENEPPKDIQEIIKEKYRKEIDEALKNGASLIEVMAPYYIIYNLVVKQINDLIDGK